MASVGGPERLGWYILIILTTNLIAMTIGVHIPFVYHTVEKKTDNFLRFSSDQGLKIFNDLNPEITHIATFKRKFKIILLE